MSVPCICAVRYQRDVRGPVGIWGDRCAETSVEYLPHFDRAALILPKHRHSGKQQNRNREKIFHLTFSTELENQPLWPLGTTNGARRPS